MKHCFRMAAIIILILGMNITNSKSEEIDKKSELYSDLYTRILNNMLLYHSEQKAIKFKESLNSGAIEDEMFIEEEDDNFVINRKYDLYITKYFCPHLDSVFDFFEYSFSWYYYVETRINPKDTLAYRFAKKYGASFDTVFNVLTMVRMPSTMYENHNKVSDQRIREGIIAKVKAPEAEKKYYYISGYLYLDDIKPIIFKDSFNMQLVKEYFELKYFNYQPSNVEIKEQLPGLVFTITFKGCNDSGYMVIIRKNNYSVVSLTNKLFSEEIVKLYDILDYDATRDIIGY